MQLQLEIGEVNAMLSLLGSLTDKIRAQAIQQMPVPANPQAPVPTVEDTDSK